MLLVLVLDGTFMAAAITGDQFGVSKGSVVNCIKISKAPDNTNQPKADTSDLISALSFTIDHIRGIQKKIFSANVIVVPWQSPVNLALDRAVCVLLLTTSTELALTSVPQVSNIIKLGFPVIVAAGNGRKNVDDVSPARVPEAITVGSTNINDAFSPFSNYGSGVTILAPGETISGPRVTGDGFEGRSGTSFAA